MMTVLYRALLIIGLLPVVAMGGAQADEGGLPHSLVSALDVRTRT